MAQGRSTTANAADLTRPTERQPPVDSPMLRKWFRPRPAREATLAAHNRGSLTVVGHDKDATRRAGARPAAGAGHLDLRIHATPKAAWQARRALDQLDLPPAVAHDAQLLVSELVTNSIRHAGLGPTG